MKRSTINTIMAEADDLIRKHGFVLPPFAYWTPEDFKGRSATRASRDRRALRLGHHRLRRRAVRRDGPVPVHPAQWPVWQICKRGGGMCYAEKLLISRQDQLSPMHTHVIKAEDIINRGGATLVVELFGSDDAGQFRRGSRWNGLAAMASGAITSPAKNCASRPEKASPCGPATGTPSGATAATCLIGEVSTVNDDETDNIFREPIGRFANIEEDVAPTHLLVSDYRTWLS